MTEELTEEEREQRFGKQIFNERIELGFGAAGFVEVIEKNGIKYINLAMYGGKDYQTRLGTPMKKIGLTGNSPNDIIRILGKAKEIAKL